MPDEARPPVAIRITRPQASDDEFLEQELDTVSRTGVTLLGAQERPQGVVLRFEVVLATGTVVLRGEGRVVGFKTDAHQGMPGLQLRFTRLDSRSKALVDKANALRERRRPSGHPSSPPPPQVSPSPPIAQMSPEPPPVQPAPVAPRRSVPPPLPARALTPSPGSVRPPPPLPGRPLTPQSVRPPAVFVKPATALAPPPGRDEALARLRERASRLSPDAVRSILEKRARP